MSKLDSMLNVKINQRFYARQLISAIKFNNHKCIISYSSWKGGGEMKILPCNKKNFYNIFGLERCTTFKCPQSKRTLTLMCGAKNTARVPFLSTQVKVFQLHMSQMYSVYLICGEKGTS